MNFLQQRRFLWWIIAVLLVFNISAGITILYHIYDNETDQQKLVKTDFLQSELNLDAGQMKGVGRIRAQFKQAGEPLAIAIRQIRIDIATEMSKSEPDTLKLKSLSEELGALQGELNYKLAIQYLDIKKYAIPTRPENSIQLTNTSSDRRISPVEKGRGSSTDAARGVSMEINPAYLYNDSLS